MMDGAFSFALAISRDRPDTIGTPATSKKNRREAVFVLYRRPQEIARSNQGLYNKRVIKSIKWIFLVIADHFLPATDNVKCITK